MNPALLLAPLLLLQPQEVGDGTNLYLIAPDIWQSRGIGHAHLVATAEGNVVIDTGLTLEAERHHRNFGRLASSGPTRYVVLTHAHADHAGGADRWTQDDVTVIVHARFPHTQRYLYELAPFQARRNRIYYPAVIAVSPSTEELRELMPQVEPDILVHDTHTFELGGTRFDVIATPGAEGADSVSVWLPDRRILFTGDFLGPIFPMWPNLYSLRGETIRSATDYIDSLDRVIALEPEMLVPSHGEPVEGARTIRSNLQRIRDAVQHVHDAVVEGMNEGRTVHELMRDIRLPPELHLPEPHGKLSWSVRGIWEGYAGWFHGSTTDLYPVPASDIYRYLAILAGGPDAVVDAAEQLLQAGQPVHALHLVEVALAGDADHVPALEVRLKALESLPSSENRFESMWLQHRIRETEQRLAEER